MAGLMQVTGVKRLLDRITLTKTVTGAKVARGLKKAGLFIQRESQKIVPVETGILKNSAFTRADGTGMDTVVRVGYTANYALYVHEVLTNAHGAEYNKKHAKEIALAKSMKGKAGKAARKVWFNRGPNQQAKFLETPVRNNLDHIRAIIREEATRP